jgi:hypothetical protein
LGIAIDKNADWIQVRIAEIRQGACLRRFVPIFQTKETP